MKKTFKYTSLLVLLVLVCVPLATALADNVLNDVTNSKNTETIIAYGSTEVGYKIVATNGDNETGCNAKTTSPAIVTINAPSVVSVTPASLTFTSCGVYQYVSFSSSWAGNYSITVSIADGGTGTYNLNPATFTLLVIDMTPPIISYKINGTTGENDWYTSDVFVDWTIIDLESEVTIDNGCVDTLIDNDSSGVTLTCVAHSSGGSSSAVPFTIKRDATPPEVSLGGGPADGASYYFHEVPATPTCIASDATSGLADACSVSGYSTAIGEHTVIASATDNAGNVGSASADYEVLPYTFNGFFAPVDMGGVFNVVKGGSTVPLKFEVFAGPLELTDVAFVDSFAALQISCDTSASIDDIELTTTGGTSLRYDFDDGQFINNWQTPKKPGTCYQVTLTTIDGSTLEALFKLK
jgi:hypothetical protein